MSNQNRTFDRPNHVAGELPILVGLLAVLIALFGILLIALGILALLAGLSIITFAPLSAFGFSSNTSLLTGGLTLTFGVVLVVVAGGLWDLETWALWLTGIATAGVIVELLWSASYGIALLVAIALLIYLIAVHRHFY